MDSCEISSSDWTKRLSHKSGQAACDNIATEIEMFVPERGARITCVRRCDACMFLNSGESEISQMLAHHDAEKSQLAHSSLLIQMSNGLTLRTLLNWPSN